MSVKRKQHRRLCRSLDSGCVYGGFTVDSVNHDVNRFRFGEMRYQQSEREYHQLHFREFAARMFPVRLTSRIPVPSRHKVSVGAPKNLGESIRTKANDPT